MRWAGAAATVGGVAAIAMTLPFATAFFLAYPGENALPVWFDSVEPRVDPVITFASRDEVYETYGRIYNVVYLLFLPALVALHRVPCPSPNGLESRGYVVMASGLAATTVGVAGDYWGNGIGFPIDVLGLLAMTIGVTVWGAGLVRGGVVPRLWAWSLLISGPGAVIDAIAIAHIPSGPPLSFATAWTVVGVMLLVSHIWTPTTPRATSSFNSEVSKAAYAAQNFRSLRWRRLDAVLVRACAGANWRRLSSGFKGGGDLGGRSRTVARRARR